MHRGYIKLWRKTVDSYVMSDPIIWWVWGHILLEVTHKPRSFYYKSQEIHLKPGEMVIGYREKASEWRVSKSKLYRIVSELRCRDIIGTRPGPFYTVISLLNWETYQFTKDDAVEILGQDWDASGTEVEQKWDYNKNEENVKNEKKKKDSH